MGRFERYLSLWVALGIAAGVGLGLLVPGAFHFIAGLELAHVNLVVAVFIWVMICCIGTLVVTAFLKVDPNFAKKQK